MPFAPFAAGAGPLRKAVWVSLFLLLAAASYQFGPDGSSEAGIPAGLRPQVRKSIARLRSRRPSRRCDAAFSLARLRAAPAVPYLIALLPDEQDSVGPVERLFQTLMMGGLSRPVWGCATTGLEQIGEPATPALIAAFASSNPQVRARATQVLAMNRDPEAARFLSGHLDDSDPFTRRQALIAVAQSELPDKPGAIRRALHDPDPVVRALAIGYAGPELGPWAYDAVVRAAQDPDPSVRERAVSRLRFWRATPAL
jgi:HEAT repeat protein